MVEAPGLLNNVRKIPALAVLIIFLVVGGVSLFSGCVPVADPEASAPTVDEPAGRPSVTLDEPPDVDEEEYAVYSDLLEDRFARGETEQVLIVDHTRVNNPGLVEMDLEHFNEYSPLAPELIGSFKERNREQIKLEPELDLSIKYQLLSQEQIDEFKPDDEASGWKLFYEKYPKTVGYIHLSRVGFNADFTQALVYYEWYHYDQPITGGYSLLNKQNGLWVVESGYEWET